MSESDTKLDVQAMAAFELFWAKCSNACREGPALITPDEFADAMRGAFMYGYVDGFEAQSDGTLEQIAAMGKRIDALDSRIG